MASLNKQQSDLHIEDISSYGQDSGNGNLIGIQPYMEVWDYATADRLYAKLDGYLREVQANDLLHAASIVVFPEYIGTWLVAAGEDESIFMADALQTAVAEAKLTNLSTKLDKLIS